MKANIISTLRAILPKKREQNTFYAAVEANAGWLKPLLSELIQQKTEKTKATNKFAADIDKMLLEHKEQEKYETKPAQDIYLTWLKMLDPKIDQPTKEKLCEEFIQRYTGGQGNKAQQKISIVDELCYLSPIISAPILLYSPLKMLSAYYRHQEKYGEFSSSICDQYFASTLAFLVNNTQLFSKEALTLFLHKIMSMLKQLAQEAYFYSDKPNYLLHEAIANWEKNSLTTFISKSFDQELQAEYDKFKETIQKKIENPTANLTLRSQLDRLVFENLLVKYNYSPESLTPIVTRLSRDQDMHDLGAIYTAHGLNKFSMFKKHLVELAKATNAPNHYEYSSLFFSSCLKYLGQEAKAIVPELAACLSAEYYAKNSYAFSTLNKEMFAFWIDHKPEQISIIVKAILALPKEQHQTPIEHFFFELSYAEMPASFYDKLSILLSDKLTPDQFIKVYSAAPEQVQTKLLCALLVDENKALTNLKNLSTAYKAGNFSAVFLRNVSKQLKDINPKLYQEAETLKLFVAAEVKDDLATDLHLLAKILENESLTHDERRSEMHRLKNLNETLRDKNIDTCPTVIKMFNSVPRKYWPDLFAYFDAEIVHWSFPQDEAHLKLFYPDKAKRPAPRKNTWLAFKTEWENVLYDTLVAIGDDISKTNLRGNVAHWALSYLDQAFTKSETYFPGLSDNILKKFFLENASVSLKVFIALHDKFRDKYHAPTYFSEKGIYNQVASWLPEYSATREIALANLLNFNPSFEPALRTPFVRNKEEIAAIALILVNSRTEHIINFIQKFPGSIRATLFKNLYELDKPGLLALMQTALSDLGKANLPKKNYLQLAEMLLSLSKNAKMDIFQIIDADANKDFLLKTLLDAEASELSSSFYPPYKLIFKIVQHYKPEELQNLVSKHIQYNLQKDDLYVLCACLKAAQKVSGIQFALPEAIEKSLIDYLTQKIPQMRYSSRDEIEIMAHFIPNFDKIFLTSKAKEIMLKNSLSLTQKEYLDHLVRVYGFSSIKATCANLKLAECNAYLVEKFSKFPDILQQIDKAIKSYHHFFAEHQHEIDPVRISIFYDNLRSAITEAAKNSNTIPIDVNNFEICKKSEIAPELAALMPLLRIKITKAEVMSPKCLSWTNIWSKAEVTNAQPPSTNVSPAENFQPKPI